MQCPKCNTDTTSLYHKKYCGISQAGHYITVSNLLAVKAMTHDEAVALAYVLHRPHSLLPWNTINPINRYLPMKRFWELLP